VAGLGFAAVGDFALDADVGEVFSKEVADFPGQLADGEGLAVGHEVEGELLRHLEFSVISCQSSVSPNQSAGSSGRPISLSINEKRAARQTTSQLEPGVEILHRTFSVRFKVTGIRRA
jgi:hypothetical protein